MMAVAVNGTVVDSKNLQNWPETIYADWLSFLSRICGFSLSLPRARGLLLHDIIFNHSPKGGSSSTHLGHLKRTALGATVRPTAQASMITNVGPSLGILP